MDQPKKKDKKPFKTQHYRKQIFKKNLGSQQEGRGEAFLQKNAVVRQYQWMQRKEQKKLEKERRPNKDEPNETVFASGSKSREETKEDEHLDEQYPRRKKLDSWEEANLEYKRQIAERKQKKVEAIKKNNEIERARKKYKEKRLHTYKLLNKKTKRGQPMMGGRIQLMLEELTKEYNAKN